MGPLKTPPPAGVFGVRFAHACVYILQKGQVLRTTLNPEFLIPLVQGCQIHFHWGPHQPRGCLQRAERILGLYRCHYSLTVKELKLPVAPCKNEFDTPASSSIDQQRDTEVLQASNLCL